MLRRAVGALVVATLAGATGATACSGNGSSPSATTAPTATGPPGSAYQVAFVGLCLARASARIDVNTARSTFYDRSHDPLHLLAQDLAPLDRALAARLLEAKEAVESDFGSDPVPPSLGPDLDRLVQVTAEGLVRLSLPAPRCP